MADVPEGSLRSYIAGREIAPTRRARIEHVLRARYAEHGSMTGMIWLCIHEASNVARITNRGRRVCLKCGVPVIHPNGGDE